MMDKYEASAIDQRERHLLQTRMKEQWQAGKKPIVALVQKVLGPVEVDVGRDCIRFSRPDTKNSSYYYFKLTTSHRYDVTKYSIGNQEFNMDKLIALMPAFQMFQAMIGRLRIEKELTEVRIKHLTQDYKEGD